MQGTDEQPSGGSWQGRRVVVVGGTSGIGAAVAERFGRMGAEVVAGGLRAEEAPQALREAGVHAVELDVTSDGALEGLVAEHGALDVLVNAAGVIRRGEEFDPVVFARVLEINLTATMRACVSAGPASASGAGAWSMSPRC